MNESNFEKFISMQHANNFLNKNFIKKSVLNEVVGFHQKQLWFPFDIVYEDTIDYMKFLYWKKFFSEIDISNEFSSNYVNLSDVTNRGFDILDSVIHTLTTSMTVTLCDVKSILPLILVNSKKEEYPLKNGCYLLVKDSNKLINLKKWCEADINLLEECNISFQANQEIAIALAIDLRRSILLDETRGYRKTLIDTGKVSTAIDYEIKNHLNKRLKTKQILDFSDNTSTKLCGLDVRVAPVISIQHIIMEELECIID